ncbi:hypothetical protein KBH77_02220 [Patescibacteria group bacterium]|nr:hypothetical protein [Patescibacteria group bacterium]
MVLPNALQGYINYSNMINNNEEIYYTIKEVASMLKVAYFIQSQETASN